MKVFLAGQSSYTELNWSECKYNLESFYYFKQEQIAWLDRWDDFLLDSGAFTFMNGGKRGNLDEYLERYADFIVKHGIKKYFELDVDSVTGYSKVKEYRRKLERLTNLQCIPVWHKSRGVDEYKRHCAEYGYIAIGGLASKEIKPSEYGRVSTLIDYAHANGTKVHGLGFTSMDGLRRCRFDTVDSTTWNRGRFGDVYYFTGSTMRVYNPKGMRLQDGKAANAFCLQEWIKFQRYAETKL